MAKQRYLSYLPMRTSVSYLSFANVYHFSIDPEDLFLNFKGHNVAEIKINGLEIKDYSNHRIWLTKNLKRGVVNEVTLCYWNFYNNNRVGLHSFIDKQSNVSSLKVLIYPMLNTTYFAFSSLG